MQPDTVTVLLQTADRTRKAQITLPRTMTPNDIIKASSRRWFMSHRVDYQVTNVTTGEQLLPHEILTPERVRNGDTLMLQPFPTHGLLP